MQIERKNYPHLDAPLGAYVHTVSYGGLLFISGLTAFNTPAQDGDLIAQAEVIFDQMQGILEAEKTSFQGLLKVTIFVTELGQLSQLRTILFRRFEHHLPASSLVQVESLFVPGLKIEVEAIAALPVA
jgi:2-iminobutanoate/2-iminopropanoate deaminase